MEARSESDPTLVQRCNYLMEYENRSAAFELWRGTHSLLIKSTRGYSAFDVYGCGLIELRNACPGGEDRPRENRVRVRVK